MLSGGAAPWDAGSEQSGWQLLMGRKYFMARNDLCRCEEQLQVLVSERGQLVRFYDRMIAGVSRAMSEIGELDLNVSSTMLTAKHGKLFRLKQHDKHFRGERAKVDAMLGHL